MRPADNIEKLVKKLRYRPSGESRKRIFDNVATVLESKQKRPVPAGQNIWRIIMKNRITKLTAAAVIIIAVMMGISSILGTGTSVAWAEVVNTIDQIDTFAYRTTQTGENEQTNYETMTYVSGSKRRINVYQSDKIVMTNYVLPAEQVMIIIMPAGKKYQRMQLKKEDLDELNRKADPRELVRLFMSSDHKKLGRKTINGILSIVPVTSLKA